MSTEEQWDTGLPGGRRPFRIPILSGTINAVSAWGGRLESELNRRS